MEGNGSRKIKQRTSEESCKKQEANDSETERDNQVSLVDNSSSTPCVICLETFGDSVPEFLPCSHAFHSSCISRWLRRNQTCPICRTQVSSDRTSGAESPADDTPIVRGGRIVIVNQGVILGGGYGVVGMRQVVDEIGQDSDDDLPGIAPRLEEIWGWGEEISSLGAEILRRREQATMRRVRVLGMRRPVRSNSL